jgi:hypothetical protein
VTFAAITLCVASQRVFIIIIIIIIIVVVVVVVVVYFVIDSVRKALDTPSYVYCMNCLFPALENSTSCCCWLLGFLNAPLQPAN